MQYGQIVLGPPGSGKSTYCCVLQKYYAASDRKCIVVNLDPANDNIPYECKVNITELIRLEDVMTEYDLGPNGGLLFCMEFLLKNLEWVIKLKSLSDCYLLFDIPGQVELFTANDNIKMILTDMEKHDYRLVAVNLVDSFYCSNPEVFISAGLTSLISMINLEIPAINVLSKVDLISKYGTIEYDLDYYTELPDMTRMLFSVDRQNRHCEQEMVLGEAAKEGIMEETPQRISVGDSTQHTSAGETTQQTTSEETSEEGFLPTDEEAFVNRPKDPFQQKYRKLYWMLCDIIDDYGLLSYIPLDIQSPTSLSKIVELADKANGFSLYQYVTQSNKADPELQVYSKNDASYYDMVDEMNEKFVQGDDDF